MKLAELGIVWIDDSQIYVADKSLFQTSEEFLTAVFKHIQTLLDTPGGDYSECGWCKLPDYGAYLPLVTKGWMIHRLGKEYNWELVEVMAPQTRAKRRGYREVWLVDFDENLTKVVLRTLKGGN